MQVPYAAGKEETVLQGVIERPNGTEDAVEWK